MDAGVGRNMRSLEEWRNQAIAFLESIKPEDATAELHLRALKTRIEQARPSTLYYVLREIWKLQKEMPELRNIIPTEDEVSSWFREGRE